MLAVHLLRAEHEIGERESEQRFDLGGGPARRRLGTGGRRQMDDLGMHGIKAGANECAETAKPPFSSKKGLRCCTA
jgi:hypothetical protein